MTAGDFFMGVLIFILGLIMSYSIGHSSGRHDQIDELIDTCKVANGHMPFSEVESFCMDRLYIKSP